MWIAFGLIAPLIYTCNNFFDKYLLSKFFKDYRGLPVYTAGVSFFFGVIVWILAGIPLLSFRDSFFVMLSGVITICSLVVYYNALSREETSNVILYFQFVPVFSLLFSFIFLKEQISVKQVIGFICILLGSIFVVVDLRRWKWKLPRAFFLILLFDLMTAFAGFLMKFVLSARSFSSVFAYESFGIGVGGILLFLFHAGIRRSFFKSRKRQKIITLLLIFFNEGLFITAKSSMYYAFVLGPLVLVSILGNSQVFFGILFGLILTFLFPKIFHESIEKGTVGMKIVCSLMLFIGLGLLV